MTSAICWTACIPRASSGLRRDIEQIRPELRAAEGKTVIEALRG